MSEAYELLESFSSDMDRFVSGLNFSKLIDRAAIAYALAPVYPFGCYMRSVFYGDVEKSNMVSNVIDEFQKMDETLKFFHATKFIYGVGRELIRNYFNQGYSFESVGELGHDFRGIADNIICGHYNSVRDMNYALMNDIMSLAMDSLRNDEQQQIRPKMLAQPKPKQKETEPSGLSIFVPKFKNLALNCGDCQYNLKCKKSISDCLPLDFIESAIGSGNVMSEARDNGRIVANINPRALKLPEISYNKMLNIINSFKTKGK